MSLSGVSGCASKRRYCFAQFWRSSAALRCASLGPQHQMVWTQLIREVVGGNWNRGSRFPGGGSTHQVDPDLWRPAGSRLRVRVEAALGRGPSQGRLLARRAGAPEPGLVYECEEVGGGDLLGEEKEDCKGVCYSLSLMLGILRVTECAGKPAFQ